MSVFFLCTPSLWLRLHPTTPLTLKSLLESNVNILEQDCNVAQLFVDAATSRKDNLYLGLDISTQSTGYAVLQPSTATLATTAGDTCSENHAGGDAFHPEGAERLREMGEANLMEWGYISGNGVDGKKGDEVDVGVIVEDTLIRVAARCGRSSSTSVGDIDKARSPSPSPSPSPVLSSALAAQEDNDNSSRGLGGEGDAAAAAAASAAGASGGAVCDLGCCCSLAAHVPPTHVARVYVNTIQYNSACYLCRVWRLLSTGARGP